MVLQFYPHPQMLLMCDFNTGFVAPEMVKKRMVVVLSSTNRQLVTVVPISGTQPKQLEPWHYEVSHDSLPKRY